MRLNSNYYLININRWNHLVVILFLIFLSLITYTFGAEVGEGAGEQKETMPVSSKVNKGCLKRRFNSTYFSKINIIFY